MGVYPHVDTLRATIIEKYPHMATGIEANLAEFGDVWMRELDQIFNELLENSSIERLIEGYAHFTTGIMLSQKRYELSGRYEYSTFEEVRKAVYDNVEYVSDEYMPGLLLSHYLWPHHYRLLTFFRSTVLNFIRAQNRTQMFCEVGVGTGLYARYTAQLLTATTGFGYDISEAALTFAKEFLGNLAVPSQITLEKRDIVANPPDFKFDFLVCQEVLEHLEDAQDFADHLANLLAPGGFAYITAALTAGQIDHLYLFESVNDVEIILKKANLNPLMMQMDGARRFNIPEMRPRVAAYLCQRGS